MHSVQQWNFAMTFKNEFINELKNTRLKLDIDSYNLQSKDMINLSYENNRLEVIRAMASNQLFFLFEFILILDYSSDI